MNEKALAALHELLEYEKTHGRNPLRVIQKRGKVQEKRP